MLDSVCVFTLTGVVLWSTEIEPLREDVYSRLVKEVLLPSKQSGGANLYDTGASGYVARWAVSNANGIVAAAVIAKSLASNIPYAEALVGELRDVFVRKFGDRMTAAGKSVVAAQSDGIARSAAAATLAAACAGASVLRAQGVFAGFANDYDALLNKYEGRRKFGGTASASPLAATPSGSAAASASTAGQPQQPTTPSRASQDTAEQSAADTSTAGEGEGDEDGGEGEDGPGAGSGSPGGVDRLSRLAALKKLQKARPGPAGRRVSGPGSAGKKDAPGSGSKDGKGGPAGKDKSSTKEGRTWDTFTYDSKTAGTLDKSKPSTSSAAGGGEGGSGSGAGSQPAVVFSGNGASGSGADLTVEEDEDGSGSGSSAGWLASAGSWVNGLTGTKPLTRTDLQPVVDSLRQLLQSKNVATEVAEALCESVAAQLEGTRLDSSLTSVLGVGTAGRVAAAVTAALRTSIERVLTPTAPVDILREVRAKRAGQAAAGKGAGAREPYVLVFCGVNGVGKSTTLSKIAFHLKDHGHSVLLAACDSFRSGAVEQLRTHGDRLGIPLHQAGYNEDPVAIAANAIRKAKGIDIDVVLVDTAGRMQNNAGLMLQLAKLVAVNAPDRVLFVGEALVGNDGVDQLLEFNRALTDLSQGGGGGGGGSSSSAIHGIVLTKFDTVDDKVGAALSMTYKTGIPIVFLGTGQQYPDLRKLNTGAVVKALLTA